jgi:hypothetical protein
MTGEPDTSSATAELLVVSATEVAVMIGVEVPVMVPAAGAV